jgi:hypothetical protein
MALTLNMGQYNLNETSKGKAERTPQTPECTFDDGQ